MTDRHAPWRAEAERLGLALSDEDLAIVRDSVEQTRAALHLAAPDAADWADPPCGYLPPADRPEGETGR